MKTVIFRWIGGSKEQGWRLIKHDFRIYNQLPPHILNGLLYEIVQCDERLLNIVRNENLNVSEMLERIKEYYKTLYDEQQETFNKMKKAGIIPKNLNFSMDKVSIHGIIAASQELREELEQDKVKMEKFIKDTKLFINSLAALLGSEVLYIVAHKDESTINIHFALRNLRTKSADVSNLFGISNEDLKKIEKGIGKAISSTFKRNWYKERGQLRDYQFTYSELQDWVYYFFSNYLSYDIERGIHKEARIRNGEPWITWKHIPVHSLSNPHIRRKLIEYKLKQEFGKSQDR